MKRFTKDPGMMLRLEIVQAYFFKGYHRFAEVKGFFLQALLLSFLKNQKEVNQPVFLFFVLMPDRLLLFFCSKKKQTKNDAAVDEIEGFL